MKRTDVLTPPYALTREGMLLKPGFKFYQRSEDVYVYFRLNSMYPCGSECNMQILHMEKSHQCVPELREGVFPARLRH